ncbi:hypothetical protein CYY_003636 [Polysphondylium violaceum]|uniref:EamA domain-containing protein n=1 Tax=Polysphondylium violaceum TaxID=133409 RepID=A0A8J4PZE7_9MYCE|nr:hypothetical protein CYY_003636 [Polysphondylium violaceum]
MNNTSSSSGEEEEENEEVYYVRSPNSSVKSDYYSTVTETPTPTITTTSKGSSPIHVYPLSQISTPQKPTLVTTGSNSSSSSSGNDGLNQDEFVNIRLSCDKNFTKGEVSPIFVGVDNNQESVSDDETPTINNSKNGGFLQRFLSIILVCAIAFFMATTAELSQFIVGDSYRQPYTLVFFNTLFLMFSFPIELVVLRISISKKRRGYKSTYTEYDPNESFFQTFKNQFTDLGAGNTGMSSTNDSSTSTPQPSGHTFKKTALCSFFLSILFVGLNYIWMSALPMTSVSTSTALYQSATVFVFIFSIFILKEKITILKTIPVVLFIAGVIGITLADNQSKSSTDDNQYPNSTLGDVLMLISALLWGFYEVLTTKFFGDANRTVVNTFIGLVGFFNLLFGIPMIAILHVSGAEPFAWPTVKVFGMLVLNGFLGFGLNYLINWGLTVTSPLFIRSGELMAIPATLFFDIIFKHVLFPLISLPGFLLIVAGFIMSIFLESRHIKEKQLLQQQQLQQQAEQQKSKQTKLSSEKDTTEMNELYL